MRFKEDKKAFFFAALAGLVTLLVYLPALKNGFVNWDDRGYVYENLDIRHLDLIFLKHAFTEVTLSNWHPLTTISYAIDYAAWGLNPLGYHLVNIVLHAIDSALVGVLAIRLVTIARPSTQPRGLAIAGLAAALLFGLHPAHVESVAWVAERKDVLSTFFFLLTVLSYMKYARTSSISSYMASVILFTLSLLSKPMAVTLPAVLLLLDLYPLGRLKEIKKVILDKVPFAALSLASVYMTVWAQHGAITTGELPLATRTLTAIRAYAFYIYKAVLPVDLAPFYPYNQYPEFLSIEYGGALVLLLIITGLCLFVLKRSKAPLSALLFYLITLLPVIGFIQLGGHGAADRYTYLPSIAPFILLGAGAAMVSERKNFFPAVAGVLAVITIAFSFLTIRQIGVWKDSVSLWTHEIRLQPYGSAIPYYNLASAYESIEEYDKALEQYNNSIKVDPYFSLSYINRGNLFYKFGKYSEAARDFSIAVQIDPGDAMSHYSLGLIFMKLNEREKAAYHLEAASRMGVTEATGFLNYLRGAK